MATILALLRAQPVRSYAPGEDVITAGDATGEIYVLETGRLSVLRDGVELATIAEPGAIVGEMSVLLGTDPSATVRAVVPTTVRVIDDPIPFLERTPLVALQVATLACARLDATSRLLVQLKKESAQPHEGFLSRIWATLTEPAPRNTAAHE